MAKPIEDRTCYASAEQRDVLLRCIEAGVLAPNFFLTGGTALAVFYLHHRESNDLDFFSIHQVNLAEIDFIIKTQWQQNYHKIKESRTFLSLLLNDVKVEFVIDPLSIPKRRSEYRFESGLRLPIDTTSNICSNKLTTLASRTEPKDFVDFFYLSRTHSVKQLESTYREAAKKDAIFDDPPTAAYQIEQGLTFLLENFELLPELRIEFDQVSFTTFYRKLISWIYSKGAPG